MSELDIENDKIWALSTLETILLAPVIVVLVFIITILILIFGVNND